MLSYLHVYNFFVKFNTTFIVINYNVTLSNAVSYNIPK